MSITSIDKEQVQNLMREVLSEIGNIRKASEAYYDMINREYEESNLHFLKKLSNMFGTEKEHNGIGAQTVQLAAMHRQADDVLEEYFREAD